MQLIIDANAWKHLFKQHALTFQRSRVPNGILLLGAGLSEPVGSGNAHLDRILTFNYDAVVESCYETFVKTYRAELATHARVRRLRAAVQKALAKALEISRALERALLELMLGSDVAAVSVLVAPALSGRSFPACGNLAGQQDWLRIHGPRPPSYQLKRLVRWFQQVNGRVHSPLAA